MKIRHISRIIFLIIFMILSAKLLPAQTYLGTGTITEIIDGSITLYIAGAYDTPNPIQTGDLLEFSYTAGMMEMNLGVFEIGAHMWPNIQVTGKSVNIPPEENMSVNIYLVEKTRPEPTKDFIELLGQRPPDIGPVEALGKVSSVSGKTVEISLDGQFQIPSVDNKVELFYVTSTGKEILIGEWKVTDVHTKSIRAVPVDAVASPKIGMRAVIHIN